MPLSVAIGFRTTRQLPVDTKKRFCFKARHGSRLTSALVFGKIADDFEVRNAQTTLDASQLCRSSRQFPPVSVREHENSLASPGDLI